MIAAPLSGHVARARDAAIALFERLPWLGWVMWIAVCVVALLRVHPRRFGSTFAVYFDASRHFWSGEPLYDLTDLGGYLYWPAFLVVLRPLLWFEPSAA